MGTRTLGESARQRQPTHLPRPENFPRIQRPLRRQQHGRIGRQVRHLLQKPMVSEKFHDIIGRSQFVCSLCYLDVLKLDLVLIAAGRTDTAVWQWRRGPTTWSSWKWVSLNTKSVLFGLFISRRSSIFYFNLDAGQFCFKQDPGWRVGGRRSAPPFVSVLTWWNTQSSLKFRLYILSAMRKVYTETRIPSISYGAHARGWH